MNELDLIPMQRGSRVRLKKEATTAIDGPFVARVVNVGKNIRGYLEAFLQGDAATGFFYAPVRDLELAPDVADSQ